MKALEITTSSTTPLIQPRDDDEQAVGRCHPQDLQGGDARVTTPHHTLGKGEFPNPKTSPKFSTDFPEPSRLREPQTTFGGYNREYKLPKVDFPKFEGEHPQVWREQCEKYFAMFQVPPHL